MLTLFYRGWAQAQPAVSFDRPAQDRFGTYLGAWRDRHAGLPGRDAMPDLAKRHFAGHLSCQTRHPDGLRSMLAEFLRLPVRIEEFIGHWLVLPPIVGCASARRPARGLWETTTLGGRVWDHQSKFRVRSVRSAWPITFGLLPGGETLQRIKALVRNYVGDQLDWDLNPVLAAAEVPPLRLGSGGRLGWTTWLASGPLGR
jgi:type VI secretion system protein ImpH